MLKHLFLLIIVCGWALFSVAQSEADIQMPKIVPPSADAASLGKYGQIPVDKSTGIPQISVPIYEIKTPRFSLPISISYHASGIKVEEISSWIGAGWSLNAGGIITRSMIGSADDGGWGFLTNRTRIKKTADIKWPDDIVYISDVVNKVIDTDPDNFFFNFNNHSGSFVFGSDGKPVLIPYHPLQIAYNLNNTAARIDNFSILDEQGNSYYFNDKETVTSSINSSLSGVSSWYLTRMVSADLSDSILFNYTIDPTPQTEFSHNFSQDLTDLCNSGTTTLREIVKTTSSRVYNPVRLSSITFKNGKLDFIAKGARLDDGNFSLDSIKLSTLDNSVGQYDVIKKFALVHNYFYSTITNAFSTTEKNKYRLNLLAFQEIDKENTVIKTHQFDYNSQPLPPIFSYAQDKWGYYNGHNENKTLLESKQVTYQPNSNASPQIALIGNDEGANRSVSEISMQAGVLQKITYPTGGTTFFNYQSNKISSVISSPGSITVTALGAGGQSGTVENASQFYTPTGDMINTGGNFFHIKISKGNIPPGYALPYVKIVKVSDGTTVYYNETDGTDLSVGVTLQVGIQYQLITEAHGPLQIPNSNTPYAIISTSYSLQSQGIVDLGGLRISSMKHYSNNGILAESDTFRYGNVDINDTSGAGLQLSLLTADHFARQTLCTTPNTSGQLGNSFSYTTTYSNNSYYPLSTLNGSPVGYPIVTVYKGDPNQNIGKSVSKFDIYPDSILVFSMPSGNGIKPINVNWKNGEPSWQGNFRNDGNNQYTLVNDITSEFENLSRKNGIGTVIQYTPEPIGTQDACSYFINPTVNNINGQVRVFSGGGANCEWFQRYFSMFDYPISTGSRLLKRSIAKDYAPDGTANIYITTDYVYNNEDQLVSTSTTSSKGSTDDLVKKYTYPSDYPGIEPYSTMVSRNIISPVIEQTRFRGTSSIPFQSFKTNYGFWSGNTWTSNSTNIIVPQTVQTKSISQTNYETRLRYHSYDQSGNVRTVSKENDVLTSYSWGYGNQYPIAEVKNAASQNIFYTSFEDIDGNSVYGDCKTGIKSRINGYNKIITGIDNGEYIFSYWQKSANKWIFTNSVINVNTGSFSININGQVDDVRFYPKGAEMTTQTFIPGIGMTSQTDVKGMTTYYDYDGFSRLKTIRDKDSNIVKRYQYVYANSSSITFSQLDSILKSYRLVQSGLMHSFFAQNSTTPRTQYLNDPHLYYRDGVAQLPDELKNQPLTFYTALNLNLRDPYFSYPDTPRFCFMQNGYSVEWRLRFPHNQHNGHSWYVASNFNFAAGFTNAGNGTADGTYLYGYSDFDGRTAGYHNGGNDFGYIWVDNANALDSFQNIKLQVTPTMYRVYYNNTMLKEYPRDTTVPIDTHFYVDAAFLGNDGEVDYIKVYDNSGNVKFMEDFSNPDTPARPDPTLFCQPLPDCQTAFTNYFNQTMGTTFTFAQINSLYLTQTGQPLNVCN